MIVCATYNIKGGVGKTSAAVNLAYLASVKAEGGQSLPFAFHRRIDAKQRRQGRE